MFEELGTKPLEDLKSTVLETDVSSFEILHSGLIGALVKYLTSEDSPDGMSPRKDRDSRLRRFSTVFLNVKVKYGCEHRHRQHCII